MTGPLNVPVTLAGSSASVSSMTGTLIKGGYLVLVGTSSSVSSMTGTLGTGRGTTGPPRPDWYLGADPFNRQRRPPPWDLG